MSGVKKVKGRGGAGPRATEDEGGAGGGARGDGDGTQGGAGAGSDGQMGLGPPNSRIDGDLDGAKSQEELEKENERKIKKRGGAMPEGLMPPGWRPPQGPPGDAPPEDKKMEEEKAADGDEEGDADGNRNENEKEDENENGENGEPGEEQYMESGGEGDPRAGRPTFFSQEWVEEVKDARAGKVSKRPTERADIAPLDQKKLMLHLDWDETNIVLQNEEHFTMKADSSTDAQVAWQALLAMNKEELKEWMKKQDPGGDVLMVVEEKDLPAIGAIQRVLHLLQPEGLGILVLMDSEPSLFPKISDMVGGWPWRRRRVTRFERPLQYVDGTKKWAVVTCSSKASRENGLQPNLLTTRLGEAGHFSSKRRRGWTRGSRSSNGYTGSRRQLWQTPRIRGW